MKNFRIFITSLFANLAVSQDYTDQSQLQKILDPKFQQGCLILIYNHGLDTNSTASKFFIDQIISKSKDLSQLLILSGTLNKNHTMNNLRNACSVTVIVHHYQQRGVDANKELNNVLQTTFKQEIIPLLLPQHSVVIHIAVVTELLISPKLIPTFERRPITLFLLIVTTELHQQDARFLLCNEGECKRPKPTIGIFLPPQQVHFIHLWHGGNMPHCIDAPWLDAIKRRVCPLPISFMEILASHINFTVKFDWNYRALQLLPNGFVIPTAKTAFYSAEIRPALNLVGLFGHSIIFCDRKDSFYSTSGNMFHTFFHKVGTWTGPLPWELWVFMFLNFCLVVFIQVAVMKGRLGPATFEGFRVLVRQDVVSANPMISSILISFSWVCFTLLQIYEGRFTSLVLIPLVPDLPSSLAELISLNYKIIADNQSHSFTTTYSIDLQIRFPHLKPSEFVNLFEFRKTPDDAYKAFVSGSDKFIFIDTTKVSGVGERRKGIIAQWSELDIGKTCHELNERLTSFMHYWMFLSSSRDVLMNAFVRLKQSGIPTFFDAHNTHYQDKLVREKRREKKRRHEIVEPVSIASIKLDHVVPVLILMAFCMIGVGGIGLGLEIRWKLRSTIQVQNHYIF
ncbi:uncharacterized protein LOC110845718 [Folsomia candida]|uniref:Uncharacterized protein n=1 Tax=Folsomia candida TaxID=158441 RepID=A0A226EIR7_FOLCA|nr:uncharacterized protein LOC110845718 [Folsomia candida]OXA57007.1 hypothetical protein Fcan01_06799 [Folsomia candida]